MRFSKVKNEETTLSIDEHESTVSRASSSSSLSSSSQQRKQQSSIQCHTLRQDHMPCSRDKPSPSAESIYTEIVKAIGNDEFLAEKRLLKRASWSPAVLQEHGLPPTGKRIDNEQIPTLRNANRVRLRPKVARYYQPPPPPPQQHHPPSSYPPQVSPSRPVSFNDRYDRLLLEYQQQKLPSAPTNRTSSFSFHRREPSRSPSSSSVDTIVQITTRASPSIDNSDFISDTSAASSVTTTTNTITSLASTIPSQLSRRASPAFERFYASTKRPLSSDYQQQKQSSTHLDYKSSSPALQTTNVPSSSPISFFSPRSTSSPSTTTTTYTCPKGHEQPLSSPTSSAVNQYAEFTLQTFNADTTRDDCDSPLPSSTRTARTVMTMSVSPNRHHHRARSAKAITTSAQMSSSANNTDGLKQQQERDQTASPTVSTNGCLKSPTNPGSDNRIRKSVHFDWHTPREMRSTTSSPVKINSTNNYRPSVTIASSSSSSANGNSKSDIDEQKKLFDDQHHVETLKEREKFETTRTTISPNPLTTTTTTNTILRSFSLSPSPLSREEKNDGRRQREEEEEEEKKKENVDEPYCTTSRRVTTAATHLHCTTNSSTVTFNDGTNNVSQKRESNTPNNSNPHLLKRASPVDQSMPLNSLLVKTSSLNTIIYPPNPPATSSTAATAKKLISNGLLSLIGRSNSNQSKSASSTEENKQLRRTSSTQLRAQRKTKQQSTLATGTNGSERLSADVEAFFPPPSPIHQKQSKIAIDDTSSFDKAATNQKLDLQQPSTDKNINATGSTPTDSTSLLCTSIPSNSTSTATMTQSNAEDSLNNGLLFQPVTDPKCDYVLHHHQTTTIKEPFFLSPPKSTANREDSTMMQTSTLIISTPQQYHYYLYPPVNNSTALSSSSSSSTTSSSASLSSTSKKNSKIISTTNRTISNVSINSVSTNSSSSYPSCESHTHETDFAQSSQTPIHAEDETPSSSTYSISNHRARQKKVVQSALIDWKTKSSMPNADSHQETISKTKPVILSDSVQAFWPPPPSPSTLDTQDPGLPTTMTLNTEQSKQSESKSTLTNNHLLSSSSPNRHPLEKEELISYSEQHLFANGCLRNASNTSLEDTQASYTERLREKSRSIPMNGTNDRQGYLTRSISKDALNNHQQHSKLTLSDANESHLSRPKSAGQQLKIERTTPSTSNSDTDFQSKREFFENRIYTDHTASNTSLTSIQTNILPTKPKLYTLSPSNSPNSSLNYSSQTPISHHSPRNMTRRSWNDLSSQQTSTLELNPFPPPPPPTIKKPVRIVKVVQPPPPPPPPPLQPASSFSTNEFQSLNRPLPTSKTYLLAKPGLFSASPLSSSQKLPIKTSAHSPRREESDLQTFLKDFLSRFPHHHLLNDLSRSIISSDHHLSTEYTRSLFPIPDRLRRTRSRHSSDGDTSSLTTSSNSSSDYIHRTVSNDSCIYDDDVSRQVDDVISSLKKRLDILKENQRAISDESEDNQILGLKLLNIIESNGESNEIEKFKLHINEIDTITSILLKLSSRLAKIENDLLTLPENNDQLKTNFLERREKAQQKYDEAKTLKDGIDRRSRLVTTILRKYLSNEQYDDYEHFIRMKSTLLMDAKDIEEKMSIIEKQLETLQQVLLTDYPPANRNANFQGNSSSKILSSTA